MACTASFSLGEVSYSNTFWSTQPLRAGRAVAMRSVRLKSGTASFQAWATASSASVAAARSTTVTVAFPSGAVNLSTGPTALGCEGVGR